VSTAIFIIRPGAAADLEGIEEYLAENASVEVAAYFLDTATAAFRRLASQPMMVGAWSLSCPASKTSASGPCRFIEAISFSTSRSPANVVSRFFMSLTARATSRGSSMMSSNHDQRCGYSQAVSDLIPP
jgi:hypothetical protein